MSGRMEGIKNIFSEENMTLYENVATSTLINLFNSPNREEYKTKIIYDFLLKNFDKKRFEDISSVEEQTSNESNTSIPDFVINFINSNDKPLRYEVKINNASLTESETNETKRDVFLIPSNYKYINDIPIKKIIYWEDLFDELDNQDIVIDGLDKVRNIINYPKQNLVGKTWEVIANLKDSWPEVQMDLRNVKINKNLDLYIPLFPDAKDADSPLLSIEKKIEKKRENLVLYKKRRTQYRQCCEIMTVAEFKRTSDCYQIALKFYNKIFKNLTEKELKKYNLSQTDTGFYNSVLELLYVNLSDKSLGDGYFYYKQNQYVYFIKLKEKNRYEIGFGNAGQGFSENVQNNLAQILDKALDIIKNKGSIRKYKNSKWVCTRFNVNGENGENQFLSAIKAMLG